MHSLIARILLLLVVFTIAVPESYAKRAGSGRSSGRQSSALKQKPAAPPVSRTAPAAPPAPAPIQRAQPDAPPAPVPPTAPRQTLPREAGSPWGGMLGGALLGLGLGSLMSSNDRQPDTAAQSEGGSGSETGSGASGTSEAEAAIEARQASEPVPQNKLGPVLLLTVLAAIVFLAARRFRARRR
ncbi:hypothetical protein [Noviherbaspirillum aridicola]|uniref:MYXO-CTERM domain-containing protein n=1 Tax=Noviherbaspirillum aridicola TaxID=2849687 RepID=A0ABQ4Q2S3_9BURK|nr:hypothetical protein [Noviherbaspirillum aridicola]GIZ51488.1 hypothetical protein NCCP691_15020 [Noviherbaspirillum aridicola]